MKKLFSIALTFILLLNIFGYYGVFLGLQFRNERSIERALDMDVIDQSQAVVLKVAMSVPYMPDQSAFETVKGKFEYNGELYRLVKQRYAKDTLTVVCIKDTGHKKINQVLSRYAQTFTDTPGHHPASKLSISFLKEYVSSDFSIQHHSSGWTRSLYFYAGCNVFADIFPRSIAQPPEVV